tara:strand:- start:134 stop:526 length:393 start_codon:yes stop_codon:yes gene_type:complete
MGEKIMMKGFVTPFQNKGGGSYNMNFPLNTNTQYGNTTYLGGVNIVTDLNKTGMNISRGCSIDIDDNPEYEKLVEALKSKFDGVKPHDWFASNNLNSIEVEFEFMGESDTYIKKTDTTYRNIHVKDLKIL